MSLTHRQLCELGARYLQNNCKFDHILIETGYRKENPDVFAYKKYYSVLIECKASRSDFLTDKKKPFRQDPLQGVGQMRLYLCNEGVAKQEEVPKGWRLLVAVDEDTIDFPFNFTLIFGEKFKVRNADAELGLMNSWEYRKEHNCLPNISTKPVCCISRADEEARDFLKENGEWLYWDKYYGEELVIQNLKTAMESPYYDKNNIPKVILEKYENKMEEV